MGGWLAPQRLWDVADGEVCRVDLFPATEARELRLVGVDDVRNDRRAVG